MGRRRRPLPDVGRRRRVEGRSLAPNPPSHRRTSHTRCATETHGGRLGPTHEPRCVREVLRAPRVSQDRITRQVTPVSAPGLSSLVGQEGPPSVRVTPLVLHEGGVGRGKGRRSDVRSGLARPFTYSGVAQRRPREKVQVCSFGVFTSYAMSTRCSQP